VAHQVDILAVTMVLVAVVVMEDHRQHHQEEQDRHHHEQEEDLTGLQAVVTEDHHHPVVGIDMVEVGIESAIAPAVPTDATAVKVVVVTNYP